MRTWAPIGEPPILRVPCSYKQLNVISGITPKGRLFMQIYNDTICGEQVVTFLKHLLHHISGKLLIIWDGASIHRGQVLRDFLSAGGSQRIHLERLPGYAPDLNPDEGIWGYLKRHELGNVVCGTRAALRYELRLATARLRHKQHVIQGCITQAGLEL